MADDNDIRKKIDIDRSLSQLIYNIPTAHPPTAACFVAGLAGGKIILYIIITFIGSLSFLIYTNRIGRSSSWTSIWYVYRITVWVNDHLVCLQSIDTGNVTGILYAWIYVPYQF